MMQLGHAAHNGSHTGFASVEAVTGKFIEQAMTQSGSTLLSRSGQTVRLQKELAECILGAELKVHMRSMTDVSGETQWGNYRNGSTPKNVHTSAGMLELSIPRVRYATFEPKLIPRYQRRLPGFDDSILALYGKGMTSRDIGAHLSGLYDNAAWTSLSETVTADVVSHVRRWQSRELEAGVSAVYFGALDTADRTRDDGASATIYFALGLQSDLSREILGFWLDRGDGPALWPRLMRDLRDRGLAGMRVIAAAPIEGLAQAAELAFPSAKII